MSQSPHHSTHLSAGRISEFWPGSCFPNWLEGKPRTTSPSCLSSSCSAFSSAGKESQNWVSRGLGTHPCLHSTPWDHSNQAGPWGAGINPFPSSLKQNRLWGHAKGCTPGPRGARAPETLTNILQGQASVCGYVDEEHCLPFVPLKGDVLVPIEGESPVAVDGVVHRGVAVHLWGEEHPMGAGWGLLATLLPIPTASTPLLLTEGTAASVVSPALNAAGSSQAPACQGLAGGTG